MFKRKESAKTTSQMLDEIRSQVSGNAQVEKFPSVNSDGSTNEIAKNTNSQITNNEDDSDLESVLLSDNSDSKDEESADDENDNDLIDDENGKEDDDEDLIDDENDESTEEIDSNEEEGENEDLIDDENEKDDDEDLMIDHIQNQNTIKPEQPAKTIELKKPEIKSTINESFNKSNNSNNFQDVSTATNINPVYKNKTNSTVDQVQNSNIGKSNNLEISNSSDDNLTSFIDNDTNKSISKLMDMVKKQAGKLVVEKNFGGISLEEFIMSAVNPKLDQYISTFMKDNLAKMVEEKVQAIVEREMKKIIDNSK